MWQPCPRFTVPGLPTMPTFRLDQRRALITVAGRGMGAAATATAAAVAADASAVVTLVSHTAAELESVADTLGQRGGHVQPLALDVTDSAALARAITASDPFEMPVQSTDINRPALLTDTNDNDLDVIFDLNVRATLAVCREMTPGMVAAARGGSFADISSQKNHVGGSTRGLLRQQTCR